MNYTDLPSLIFDVATAFGGALDRPVYPSLNVQNKT